ncbi:ATP-binding protein [Luteibacter sp. CQ10]|uniref:ATP-binding protein n=1 Tax=Luteibacter sp. CQ10 TaxID=2805821 RepID=UPI0034A5AF60
MRLRIPNRLEDVFVALEQAAGHLDRHHIDEACRADVRLVLEELLVNIVRHGYPDGRDGEIRISIDVHRDHVQLKLEDDAQPFDARAHELPDLAGDIADREIGGLGLHLIHNIADALEYTRHGNRNITVARFCPTLPDESSP